MAQQLRIALALPGLHRVARGAETAFEHIARELALLGHNVTVFGSGLERPGEPYQFQHIPCVPREKFESWPKIPFLRTHYAYEELTFAAALLRQYRPGDFDVSMTCSYPYTSWVLRRGQTRHVFVTQNGDWMVHSQNAEYRFFDCDGLVCTNPQYFARHSGHFPSALIPNGVDPTAFSPAPGDRADYGLPVDPPIALMVSALIPSKHVIEGIRAAAKVPGLFLAIAGDGELRDEVERAARELLPGRFRRFSLQPKQMPGVYRCADALLHMSRDEPFGIVYTEALATGLPIVAHDWEATRWMLEDCAILVDTADENAVASALAGAIEDRSAQNSRKRRELVQRRFSWPQIGEQYSCFLRQLCGEPDRTESQKLEDVGVVAIGRNEGDRLVRCLQSVRGRAAAVVYVDSASDDQSVAHAKNLGAEVVDLDKGVPFTAALARNLGAERVRKIAPDLKYIQFVDGDCEVRADWMPRARRELQSDEHLAAVCGRRRERFPRRSIYNRLIDIEWNTPTGPALSVGGDAMFRLAAFDAAGGYDPSLMAGEEPQLCLRLRHADWKILRIDAEMTLHDAAMTRLGQWWRRHVRAGYGTLDVNRRFKIGGERIFGKMVRSAPIWAAGWPAAIICAVIVGWLAKGNTGAIVAGGVVLAAFPLQILRLSVKALLLGMPPRVAIAFGTMTMLSKWPWFQGQVKYRLDRARGRGARIIEYKHASVQADSPHKLLAYFAGQFPLPSETFVYREVRGLRERGWSVLTVSLNPAPRVWDDLADLQRDGIVAYRPGFAISAVLEMLRHPIQSAKTLLTAIGDAIAPQEPLAISGRIKLPLQAFAALGLSANLRAWRVEHIHCHFAHAPTTVGMYAARQLKIPFSFMGHANDLFQRRTLLAKKLGRAKFVACISNWHRDFYNSVRPRPNGSYEVIRCGVDFAGESEIKSEQKEFRILAVCRLVEKKGIDTLIQSVAELKRRGLCVKLTVAGDGPQRQRLENLAAELHCSECVAWLGEVTNSTVRLLLQESDVMALPCRQDSEGDRDGLPVALMEAMACGTPVVAGNIPAIGELIENGVSGFLVPGSDPLALADILAMLSQDPVMRRGLAEKGRDKIRAEFSLSRTLDQLERRFSAFQHAP